MMPSRCPRRDDVHERRYPRLLNWIATGVLGDLAGVNSECCQGGRHLLSELSWNYRSQKVDISTSQDHNYLSILIYA
jgi:hypothetical protein